MIASSALSAVQQVSLPMPWETGLAGILLNGQPILPLPQLRAEFSLPFVGATVQGPTATAPGANKRTWQPPLMAPARCFARAVKKKRKVWSVDQKEGEKRCRAMEQWIILAKEAGDSSRVSRFLADCRGDPELELKVMKDTLSSRATPTLEKRAGSVLLFIRWMRVHYPGVRALPALEQHVYRYVCELRDLKAPPTRATSLLEALNLTNALLELEPPESHASGRVKGAATDCLEGKRMTVQRPPLTVLFLMALEDMVMNGGAVEDRIFAGFILFLT